ncbi:MAG: N-6 DNA methylase [Planctomycetota bacterium]
MKTESKKPRYGNVSYEKSKGVTYTPAALAEFIADGTAGLFASPKRSRSSNTELNPIRILDPSVGDGALILPLLERMGSITNRKLEVTVFDTDSESVQHTEQHIRSQFPSCNVQARNEDFLGYAIGKPQPRFDLIIANPPYVRTQVLGTNVAQELARQFGLKGRVDLSFAFIVAMTRLLSKNGAAGIVTSNRFMTTKAGAAVRHELEESVKVRRIVDFGDTKVFDSAAVLPVVIFFESNESPTREVTWYTKAYEADEAIDIHACRISTIVEACNENGLVQLDDGRTVSIEQGWLTTDSDNGVWSMTNAETEEFLRQVQSRTWRNWGDVFSIRVGIKTCADKVFIREDWDSISPEPKLTHPLTTHHVAGNYRASEITREVLYPYDMTKPQRTPIELADHPADRAYLDQHAERLRSRKYVMDSGRKWYEIWVPHSPTLWNRDKVVFRDIARRPEFWMDRDGTIVNGDCYWMLPRDGVSHECLWLAMAIGNSEFITEFYDRRFNNKLYAGRRRFITQYVEKFPLPDPAMPESRELIRLAKLAYRAKSEKRRTELASEINQLVSELFRANQ